MNDECRNFEMTNELQLAVSNWRINKPFRCWVSIVNEKIVNRQFGSLFVNSTFRHSSFIPVHGFHRKRGQAHRDIFRSVFERRRVLDPFALVRNHCLAGMDVERSAPVRDPQHALQHNCKLVKLRRLSRLRPSTGRAHMRHAQSGRRRIHASDVLVDQFGLITRGSDSCRLWYESRHSVRSFQNPCL
jgi:hypothetical protein